MVRILLATISGCALGLSAISSAAELEDFSLSSNLSYGYGTDSEISMQGQLEMLPAFDFTLSDNVALRASGRLRVDAKDLLEPGRGPLENYTPASEPLNIGPTGTAEIRDLYLEFRQGAGLSRFGKQQIVWGRLDGIKVLDVLNPQDFREFIIDDFEDSRISLWSGYFDYTLGDWRAELAIIPDSSGHTIPNSGAWFELQAPRFRFGSSTAQPTPPLRYEQPGLSLAETGVGLRMTRAIDLFEFSLVAYSGMDSEPLGRLEQAGQELVLERYYERQDTVGFSLDMGFGSAVFRAEYAYQPDRFFNSRSPLGLEATQLDQHRGAVGIDVEGPLAIFANVQFLVDHISDAPANLVRPAQDQVATFFLRRTFLYDTLTMEARWYRSFTDDDHLTSFSIDYALTESLSVELAAQSFSGIRAGLFGQFADRDRISLSLQHTF
ncbi:MAG: DUF1302 family protein [Gammaproteobacteria bacterium]